MAKYKVIPCVSSQGKRGWKIVSNDIHEFEYLIGGTVKFTVYYNYQEAVTDCRHLNGKGKVFHEITQDSWDVLMKFVENCWKG